MLTSPVLVLNRSYLPVHVTSVRRALVLLYQGHARVLGEEYQDYEFGDWIDLKVEHHHESIGLVNRLVRVPRVLRLKLYDRIPVRKIRFSRQNVFLRDRHTCQYCGEGHPARNLNLDHVIPRSQGGKTTWENVVCCCLECNHRKGGALLQEAGMKLLKKPEKPSWVPVMDRINRRVQFQEWEPFLPMAGN